MDLMDPYIDYAASFGAIEAEELLAWNIQAWHFVSLSLLSKVTIHNEC